MCRLRRTALLLVAALTGAAVLTISDATLARSAALKLVAPRSDVPIRMDPWAAVWDRASALDLPLSAQSAARPFGGRSRNLTARAIHDGRRLYVLLEWEDKSKNTSVRKPELFADQAAVEFPSQEGERVPFFCMGDPQATVSIWLWKASRQLDTDKGYRSIEKTHPRAVTDIYPFESEDSFNPPKVLGNVVAGRGDSSVESLIGGGFGTITQADHQAVTGVGRWQGSVWRVLFTRDLPSAGEDHPEFKVPMSTSAAFGVWDGAAKERDGQKSVAQFVSMQISGTPLPAMRRVSSTTAVVVIVLTLIVAATVITVLRRKRTAKT